ncbi:MAG TPA: helix-turn-helix domain-containing protein [Steroidobacteraceae bacterium]|jgi:AcrR family transcriptional regulator|nr:helix-turn-helix domain-containing protein [Steroidobacteraceae bacterium]
MSRSRTDRSAGDEAAADAAVNSAVPESEVAIESASETTGIGSAGRSVRTAAAAAMVHGHGRARSRGRVARGTRARAAGSGAARIPADGAIAKQSPAASERVARQRARILDAAERCFIEHGFHAASMAHIAATAGMSAGLIYRYFASKNQIVQAIIERHVETDGCPAMSRLNSREDFCAEALEMFERWRRRDDPKMNAALMLELTAEAARDPEILRITLAKDHAVMQSLARAVQRVALEQGVRLTQGAAQMRSVVLQCMVEGLACRAVRDPQLSARQLKPLVAKVIAALMS